MKQSHITYKELLELSSWGIFAMRYKKNSVCDERLTEIKKKRPIPNACRGGMYSGSPGRDLYLMLPYLTQEEMEEIADIIANKSPTIPLANRVNVSLFFRYLYGQNEKNGILASEKYLKKRKKQTMDLTLPRKFEKLLLDRFKKSKNFYGISILCEMAAHRLGDEAVIYNDSKKLEEMEKLYKKSVKCAYKCESYKHMFSPYYWAFEYFRKFGDSKKALDYSYLMVESASKYCFSRKFSFRKKISRCFKYIQKFDKHNWRHFRKKCLDPKNNKSVKDVAKNIK